jgi:hypothetical protein
MTPRSKDIPLLHSREGPRNVCGMNSSRREFGAGGCMDFINHHKRETVSTQGVLSGETRTRSARRREPSNSSSSPELYYAVGSWQSFADSLAGLQSHLGDR